MSENKVSSLHIEEQKLAACTSFPLTEGEAVQSANLCFLCCHLHMHSYAFDLPLYILPRARSREAFAVAQIMQSPGAAACRLGHANAAVGIELMPLLFLFEVHNDHSLLVYMTLVLTSFA